MDPMERTIAILHAILNISGIMFNVVLVFLIIKRTPKEIKTYSVLILNFGVCDLIACLSSILIRQRIALNMPTIYYISSGVCCSIGTTACSTLYNIWLHCASYGLYILLLLFSYRYYVLFRAPPKIRTIVIIMLIAYIPCGIQLGMTFFVLQIEGVARTQLAHIYTDKLTDKCISAYLDLYEWKTLVIEMHLTLLILPVYIVILVLRRKTIVRLNIGWMSEKTLRMHSQMLKAITYQACLPLLLGSGLVVFVLGQFLGPSHPLLQYSYIATGLTPVLTPLISLYFIKPYHDSIKQVLLCNNNAKNITILPASSMSGSAHRHKIAIA